MTTPNLNPATAPALPPRVRRVLAIAAEDHRVSVGMILSKNQDREVARARHEVIQNLARMGFSASHIGRMLRRHHTTVLYAVNKEPVSNPQRREVPVPDLSGEWAI